MTHVTLNHHTVEMILLRDSTVDETKIILRGLFLFCFYLVIYYTASFRYLERKYQSNTKINLYIKTRIYYNFTPQTVLHILEKNRYRDIVLLKYFSARLDASNAIAAPQCWKLEASSSPERQVTCHSQSSYKVQLLNCLLLEKDPLGNLKVQDQILTSVSE